MAYFIIMPGFIMPLTSRADMSCWCVSFTCICVILTISFSLWLCIMKPQSHWTIFISIMFEGIEATPRLTQAGRPRMIQGLFERSPRRRRLAVGAEVLMRRGDIRNGAGIGLRPGGDDARRDRHRPGSHGARRREADGGEEDRRARRRPARAADRLDHGSRHPVAGDLEKGETGEGLGPGHHYRTRRHREAVDHVAGRGPGGAWQREPVGPRHAPSQ